MSFSLSLDPSSPAPRGARVIPHPVARREAESKKTHFVGMVMALASWTMLFASLFLAYAVLRVKAPSWPPEDIAPLPRLLPGIATLILLASSVFLRRGIRPSGAHAEGALATTLYGTIALGSLFLALQLAVWIPLWRGGFQMETTYGSVFYGLTAFHAIHVLAGLVALACLLPGAREGRYTSSRQNAVRLTAMFWDFVDAVWVVMFIAVYLI